MIVFRVTELCNNYFKGNDKAFKEKGLEMRSSAKWSWHMF